MPADPRALVGLHAFFFVVILFLRPSSQLPPGHPFSTVVERINESGPFIGLVMAYQDEADALADSGAFVPNLDDPTVELYGRQFHIGRIREVDVVYVMSGQRRLNEGITVQILVDNFSIRGIVHYGTAGSSDDSLSFGDVSVPKFVAFTGSWKWMKFESEEERLPKMKFGAYNFPSKGENLLGKVEFKTEEFFAVGKPMQDVFWMEVDPVWFQVSQQLKDIRLKRCINETFCLPSTPRIVYGLKGSTADIFVDNAAYREYMFKEFGVSTVDEESTAVVMAAASPGVPAIVVRGVSDLAGGGSNWASTSLSSLASANALRVAVGFIEVMGRTGGLVVAELK